MQQPYLFEGILPDKSSSDEIALSTPLQADTRGLLPGIEVATIQRGEFLGPIAIADSEFPNLSTIMRYRANGQGLRFYDTMMITDADMTGLFRDLVDNVLHFDIYVRAASSAPDHLTHKRFTESAMREVPSFQNVRRHIHDAYPRGFSVAEKIYKVIDRGEWAGAVVYAEILDKPARWFSFDVNRQLRFRALGGTGAGVLLPQEKFLVTSYGTNSSPWGQPMLDNCYYPWFLRHKGFESQAIYFEKFASPTPIVEYAYSSAPTATKTNERNREEALRVLARMQQDLAIALPQGMVAKLLESARNGTISFEQYMDQLYKILSRLITGQILLGSGDKGGSYAMAKVHQEQEDNRVESLAVWESHRLSRMFRELIDRNFGPQDAYPVVEILARNLAEQQAWLQIEAAKLANGHSVSRGWSDKRLQAVTPDSPEDELVPPPEQKPTQPLAIPPTLAEQGADPWALHRWNLARHHAGAVGRQRPDGEYAETSIELASRHRALHEEMRGKAAAAGKRLEKVGADAVAKARPAIKKLVRNLATVVRAKAKKRGGRLYVQRAPLYKALKGAPGHAGLGQALHGMLQKPAGMKFAEDDQQPPDISDAAKLALALQALAIAERIARAAEDLPEDAQPGDFADSLSDPDGLAIDEAFGNLFEGNHSTNIASVATAKLRQQLASPAFRRANPYVMIVVTNPEARLGHRVMDGFILSAEDARYSALLPPFGFGCDCQAVPIPAAQALRMGLTGSEPTGTLAGFLQTKGLQGVPSVGSGSFQGKTYRTPTGETVTPGAAPGFVPAYSGTDLYVQLEALRQKAEEIRAEDAEAWAQLHLYLLWLFGYDVLRKDPPPEEQPELDQQPS